MVLLPVWTHSASLSGFGGLIWRAAEVTDSRSRADWAPYKNIAVALEAPCAREPDHRGDGGARRAAPDLRLAVHALRWGFDMESNKDSRW